MRALCYPTISSKTCLRILRAGAARSLWLCFGRHGRMLACQELGWREVPTISLAHLTQTQARAFMIADNRFTDNSTWDAQWLG